MTATIAPSRDPMIRPSPLGLPTLAHTCTTGTSGPVKVSVNNTALGIQALFNFPQGACVDLNGVTYLADSSNNVIRKIAADGTVTTLAGSGVASSVDGTGVAATFNGPAGVAVDSTATYLYVAEATGNRIRRITLSSGVVLCTVNSAGTASSVDNATGATATIYGPTALVVDAADAYVVICDSNGNKIRRMSTAGVFPVTTIAGSGAASSTDNATGTSATVYTPSGICKDSTGANMYICDVNGHVLRKMVYSGLFPVTTIAGVATSIASTDGILTVNRLQYPRGVAINADNSIIYVSESSTSNKVRALEVATGVLTSPFGSGTAGTSEGYGNSCNLYNPYALAMDPSCNNLLIVNSSGPRIMRANLATGYVSYFAGGPGTVTGYRNGVANANSEVRVSAWVAASAAACNLTNAFMTNVDVQPGQPLRDSPGILNAGDKIWVQATNHGATFWVSALELTP